MFFFYISDSIGREHLFAVAFDIRHSSWRYGSSSIDNWQNVAVKVWPSFEGSNMSDDIPASLLLNSDKSFLSFGREAQKRYEIHTEEGDTDYYFFQQVSKLFESEKVSTSCYYMLNINEVLTFFFKSLYNCNSIKSCQPQK